MKVAFSGGLVWEEHIKVGGARRRGGEETQSLFSWQIHERMRCGPSGLQNPAAVTQCGG